MRDKIKNIKIKDVLTLLLVAGIFYFLIINEDDSLLETRELLIQQESWLEINSNNISNYMNEPKSDLWVSNNGVSFTSIYSSSYYLPKKLESFKTYLVQTGWYELPLQDSFSNEELEKLIGQSLTNTVVLCKNKTAIILWMDDLKQKYENTTNSRTMIWLLFDYQTPCFNLKSEVGM